MTLMSAQNLGKAYRTYRSEWQRFGRWFGLPSKPVEEHWVLRHINFSIRAGESIGIVGQNGAGKSTLLKMITGTLQPSEGTLQINGRISAILELGMGFSHELTGRQNARHAAGLMGFNSEQIEQAMPSIEEFAEIGNYFDEPVRTYSSGMQMRVAFSVATAMRPEILIIDEALSVGDAYFQHKSFEKIRSFQRMGTTLLLVSHDRTAVQTLCDRVILLDGGTIARDGNPEEIMDFYNALIADKENAKIETHKLGDGTMQTRSGSGEANIEAISLQNTDGQPVEVISVGDTVSLHIKVRINAPIPELIVGYMIKDRLGQPVFGTNTYNLDCKLHTLAPGEQPEFIFQFPANFGIGSYSIAVALHTTDTHLSKNYEWRDLALVFNVINLSKPTFVGLAWTPSVVHIKR